LRSGWEQTRSRIDRNRDADHLANGTPTVRITWERITETPANEAARLKTILDRFSTR